MPTKLIRSDHCLNALQQHCVISIGNFDGIHLGHQALLAQVVQEAKKKQLPSLVITFDPYPFQYFHPNHPAPRLMRMREKIHALSQAQVDFVLILKFNQKLAEISATHFVRTWLVEKLKISQIIVGDDFRFGYQRQGNIDLLTMLGKQYGFKVKTMPTQFYLQERVSSTRIRAALLRGEMALANQLLGHAYVLMGRVRHGDKLGRQLGFPTINLTLPQPAAVNGIYAVLVYGITDTPKLGAASAGIRPAVGGTKAILEVHLLDFDGDLYGRHVTIAFCHKIRDEQYFEHLEQLKEQIANDVVAARQYFLEQQ